MTLSVILRGDKQGLELPKVIAKLSTAHLEDVYHKVEAATSEYMMLLERGSRLNREEKSLSKKDIDRFSELAKFVDSLPAYPDLRRLRIVDEDRAAKDIMLLVIWATKQVSVSANASTEQIKSLAMELLHSPEYSILRMEDLGIIFREGLKGRYGQIFNRLDGAVLRGWIDAYTNDLREDRMRKQNDRYLSLKEGRDVTRTAERDRTGMHEAKLKNHIETLKREQE